MTEKEMAGLAIVLASEISEDVKEGKYTEVINKLWDKLKEELGESI
jgi:hypothetical protein